MLNNKVLLFLLLLPMISKSKLTRIRKRPSIGDADTSHSKLFDQLAIANNWQTPNRIISATYAANPETGRVRHANFVVNVLPHQTPRPMVDMSATESLANTRTAEEYVSQALTMGKQFRNRAPHSSYVKYDVYEQEQAQRLEPSQLETPMRSRTYQSWQPMSPVPTNSLQHRIAKTYVEYRKPDAAYRNEQRDSQVSYSSYEPFESDHKHVYESSTYKPPPPSKPQARRPKYASSSTESPHTKGVKQFEHSVLKYLNDLDVDEKLKQMAKVRPIAYAEDNAYYRDNSAEASYGDYDNTDKDYEHTDMHFKPFKSHPTKTSKHVTKVTAYTTARPYLDPSYTTVDSRTPSIDLTFRSKARPKPIDLSALDVGQTWNHGPSYDHSAKAHKTRYHDQSSSMTAPPNNGNRQPKLHFNSQTYRDINAMGSGDSGGGTTKGYAVEEYPPKYVPFRVRDHLTSVGASISVGKESDEYEDEPIKDLQKHYRKPLHVINGVPISNPYKVNVQTLKQMFGETDGQESVQSSAHEIPTSTNVQVNHVPPPGKLHTSFSDSYHPKYNEGAETQQFHDINSHKAITYDSSNFDGWKPSNGGHRQRGSTDLYTSSSAKKPKKVLQGYGNGGNSSKRVKSIKLKIKSKRPIRTKGVASKAKSRELDTELRPPPPNK